MKENKILNSLEEFAYSLSSFSAKPIDELELIIPYENYKQLQFEMNALSYNPYGFSELKNIKINTSSGMILKISCKELNDTMIKEKLQKCFKILTDGRE